MESEHYVKDLPIMYHIRKLLLNLGIQAKNVEQKPHDQGNKFKRSKTETCWMWNEIVIITPYLIQGSDKALDT
jgi:hypothetical protein